ncbi:type I-B CRISPR-associated endonuclease Cas1b [Desulfofundulus thermocisternus]|jgi:CRISPR-associated protein Cas1|uniref:type I-B CRISPR-associated endonuclease Cas1b n=1 Tax=Desulfofundulus thermocisternus TaxID=42471 RepID=UPI000487A697|nr:type I-B CRISPR-associated endonuclease Cas1b [Desulfofundulus thermocisternus]
MSRTYYIFSSGRLKREHNTLCLENEAGRRVIPVEDVEQIYFFGETEFNSRLLDFLAHKGITAHVFNHFGYYTGSFIPRASLLSGFLLVRQVEHYLCPDKRLVLARSFVEGSIHNIRRNLEKRGLEEVCMALDNYRHALKKASSIEEVMSTEAHARKQYYSAWEKITGWEFGERTRQPPQNALNALISFGNAMTYTTVLKEIYKTALNPTISYLHEPSERRFSLALDIAEVFKPVLVDKLIFRLINQKQLTLDHFNQDLNATYLSEEGRKIFVREFEAQVESTILHRVLRRKVKYKSLIRLDLYKLIKHLLGEETFTPMKVWW